MNRIRLLLCLTVGFLAIGCNSSMLSTVRDSERIVRKVDENRLDEYTAIGLAKAWVDQETKGNLTLTNDVVKLTGEILSISCDTDGVVTIVIGERRHAIACRFAPENWSKVGSGREIDRGATISLIGELRAAGMMAPEACLATGCQLLASNRGRS